MVLCWNPFRITIQFFRRFFVGIIESAYNGAFGGVRPPSQALPRQLPQRGSQAIKFITKALGETRKFPAVLLPPLRIPKSAPHFRWKCGALWLYSLMLPAEAVPQRTGRQ